VVAGERGRRQGMGIAYPARRPVGPPPTARTVPSAVPPPCCAAESLLRFPLQIGAGPRKPFR
jgi:hypothetical protein